MIDVRIGGDRLTSRQLQAVSWSESLNQRSRCDIETFWTLEDTDDSKLLLDDGSGCILLDDGSGCILLDDDFGRYLPDFNESISIDYPDTTYRQRVLDRRPILYWGLDERPGRAAVRDWTGAGNIGTPGLGVLFRDREDAQAAVPYGGALRPNTGEITAAGFTPDATGTIQFWFRRPSGTAQDGYLVELASSAGAWGAGHSPTNLWFHLGTGLPPVPLAAGGDDEWHLAVIVWTPADRTVYVDGRLHWTGAVPQPNTWTPAAGLTVRTGNWWIDELSVEPEAVTAAEAAGDYAARAHRRVFEGISLDPVTRGREASGDAYTSVTGAGQGILLERETVKQGVVTSATRLIPDIMDDFLEGRGLGLTTDGVAFPTAAGRQRFEGAKLQPVFRQLAEIGGGDVFVQPWGEIKGRPLSGFPIQAGLRFDGFTVEDVESSVDTQEFCNEQSVVGAGGKRNETTQWFAGDGSKRVFGPVRFQPDHIIDIRVDGVSEAWTGMNPPWSVDRSVHTFTRGTAPPAPGAGAPTIDGVTRNIQIIYRSDSPLLATVEDAASQRRYGRWSRIDEDRSADDVALTAERAAVLLRRRKDPVQRIEATTAWGAMGAFSPGVLARVHLPNIGRIVETDMLVNSVDTEVQPGAGSMLKHTVDLTLGDYQSKSLDFLRQIGKLTIPLSSGTPEQRNTPIIYTVDPTDAAYTGPSLPASLGGSASAVNRERDAWLPIEGAGVALLSGRALASLRGAVLLTFTAWIKTPTSGAWTAAVRLYNRTAGVAVGTALPITNPGRAAYHIPRLTLAQAVSEYEMQYRLTYGGAQRKPWGLFVIGASLSGPAVGVG